MLPLLAAALMSTAPLPPVPSPRQLAWQRLGQYAFVHFGPNTFTDVEWGGGKEDPALFNPADFDARQWARAIKAGGFKGIILTAKHHDGFCLWPSKLSTHTVAQSPFRRDVLKLVSEACRAEGLEFGVYLSPWDRNHPAYGTPEYNAVFAGMLREVLTHYGPVFEVWFDGANGEGPNGKRQVYDWDLFVRTVRECQPKAVIFSDAGPDVRWVGNEAGVAGETCWSTIDRDRYHPGTPLYAELTEGKRGGRDWIPAECDVSIRPGWFYHADQDARVKTPTELLDLWERSVGRNGSFLLNVPPDRRGRLADPDVAALKGFGDLRERIYGHDLAQGARSGASNGRVERGVWTAALGTGDLTLAFPAATFDRVELREPVELGQRVAAFSLEARVGSRWIEIGSGTTVGNRRIVRVPPTTADALRVRVTDSLAPPVLLSPALYSTGGLPIGTPVAMGEVVPEVGGGWTLRAANAHIEGPTARRGETGEIRTLVEAGDAVSWRFAGRRGEVAVEIEAALAPGSTKATVAVEIGGQTLHAEVTSAAFGRLELGRAAVVVDGSTTLTVRASTGGVRVRAVRLRSL